MRYSSPKGPGTSLAVSLSAFISRLTVRVETPSSRAAWAIVISSFISIDKCIANLPELSIATSGRFPAGS